MNAWLLAVVSSEQQADSLPAQHAWAEETAAAKGWSLERIFSGVSTGKDGPRRLLREMIAALRAAEPNARPGWVMMIRADRVGRGRIAESQIALHEIVDLGVRIWTRNEGEIKLDSAMDQLISAARQATAAFENEVRTEKASAYYAQRRKAGAPSVTNKRPYGLRVVRGGALEPVPGEAEIIRKIFEMRGAGAGATTIGNAVRDVAPLPVKADGSPRKTPPRWAPYTVVRMLRNPKYRGTIVDEVTWQRAQLAPAHLANRHWDTTPVYPWPLAGVIRCVCGGGMYGEPGGRSPNRIRYYRCSRKFEHPDGRKGYRSELIEQQFLELLQRLRAEPDGILHRANAATSLEVLDRALREIRAEMAEIGRQRDGVWEAHARGLVRTEDVQERLDGLAAARDELASRISTLEGQRAVAVANRNSGRLASEILGRAVAAWQSPTAKVRPKRAIALAVAAYLGGVYVDGGGELQLGDPPAEELRPPG